MTGQGKGTTHVMDIRLKIIDEVDKVGVRGLASALGITPQVVYHWVKGNPPSDTNMQKLADYFGETVGSVYHPAKK